jgi:hypothetical protein
MELGTLMSTKPEDLAELQYQQLNKHIIRILEQVTNYVRNESYDEIKKMLSHSPAGDGYGLDNDFINFTYLDTESMDILEVIEKLERLITLKKKVKLKEPPKKQRDSRGAGYLGIAGYITDT